MLRPSVHVRPSVQVFAVTGGPCSGKSTGIDFLARDGLRHAARVHVVPEAATLYHDYAGRLPFGQAPSTCGRISASGRDLLWEMLLNELKRSLEAKATNRALELSHSDGGTHLVLCDRGILDSRAYLPSPHAWQRMLQLASWEEQAIASRYDHVFHMALCPEEAYNTANNRARRESYTEAVDLDSKTLAAWRPTHRMCQTMVGADLGADDFDAKLHELSAAVDQQIASAGSLAPTSMVTKTREFHLPPREIIALADSVASAPDLSQVAPAAVSIVRRIQRVDRMAPAQRAFPAEACHRELRRSAAKMQGTHIMRSGARSVHEREVDALLANPAW